MGWWQTASGAVIGDPAANIVEEALAKKGDPVQITSWALASITAAYVEDLGREPTWLELWELMEFCFGERRKTDG